MAMQEPLSQNMEDFMSTSRSVGDRVQVDAVKGPSSSSVAGVSWLEDLHIGAKLELAMLVIVHDWET